MAIPGGPGSGSGSYTLYVQVPDTLAINGNSKVMVADVFVGSIKRHQPEELGRHPDAGCVQERQAAQERASPRSARLSLLGSQHVELARAAEPVVRSS